MSTPYGGGSYAAVQPTHDVVRALLDPATPSADPVVQFFQVALSGFGYDFYNAQNNLRANDLLVREKGSGLLADAARTLGVLERKYHERYVPAATRAEPYPPADEMRRAKRIHALETLAHTLSTSLLAAESPASDAIWTRVRDTRATLERLLAIDMQLIAAVTEATSSIAALDVAAAHAETPLDGTEALLERLASLIAARRAALTI